MDGLGPRWLPVERIVHLFHMVIVLIIYLIYIKTQCGDLAALAVWVITLRNAGNGCPAMIELYIEMLYYNICLRSVSNMKI